MQTLSAMPKNYRILSIEEFVNLSDKEKNAIVSTRIVPPRLGEDEFGYMQVFYRTPVYEVEFD